MARVSILAILEIDDFDSTSGLVGRLPADSSQLPLPLLFSFFPLFSAVPTHSALALPLVYHHSDEASQDIQQSDQSHVRGLRNSCYSSSCDHQEAQAGWVSSESAATAG